MDQDTSDTTDETLYSPAIPIVQATGYIEQTKVWDIQINY